jgi:2-succinyl-6-hydroxy-2,4-cyclohexadiene-1-carboxylate synthase
MMGRMAGDLVLLHGFTQTGASWRSVAAEVGERYRVLAPDLRGHGTASGRRPASFDAVVEDVAGLVAGPFTLGGYSMGGRLALATALSHSGRVERLVLLGASPGIADPAQRMARRRADEALAAELEREGLEPFARRWAAQPLFAGQPPAVVAAAHEDRLRSTPEGLAAALRGLGTGVMASLWDRLEELTMPVALLAGERDPKFRAIATEMAPRLHDASVHVVPGAGHAAHLERPAAFAALL